MLKVFPFHDLNVVQAGEFEAVDVSDHDNGVVAALFRIVDMLKKLRQKACLRDDG